MVDAAAHRSRGAGRILYWFRTPPGIRVGRAPLDEETRQLLEQQHPDVVFDWRQLLDEPEERSAAARPRAGAGTGPGDAGSRRRRPDRRGGGNRPGSPGAPAEQRAAPPEGTPEPGE